ncbi:hypothetical protein WME76_33890 [Sorangium sp. So ce119]|uniref:hypothetical protein n=1 Tax=Sorangium sp. So ce119 TaxID=3133279 RepID=UPI003F610A59
MKSPAFALAAALALTAASAGAEEQTAPPRYPPSSVRPKLIVGGVAVTALAYGAGFLAATSWPDVPGSSELKIPIAGPWMALAKNGCAADDPDCGAKLYVRGALTVVGGLAQLAGLALVGEGIFMTTEGRPAQPPSTSALTVLAAPVITATGMGIGVVGTF